MRAEPGSVVALRLRRPSWRDPRLAIGIALVMASVALGIVVVARSDATVGVYAVGGTAIVPGDPLAEGVRVVRVRIDGLTDRYVLAGDPLGPDDVALRPVGAGELLPRSAVGSAAALTQRPVAIPVDGPRPAGLARGSLVDIWIAVELGQGDYATPEKVLASAQVADVDDTGGGLAAVAVTAVQVLLDDLGTARVLEALADGDRVDVVVVPGSAPRE